MSHAQSWEVMSSMSWLYISNLCQGIIKAVWVLRVRYGLFKGADKESIKGLCEVLGKDYWNFLKFYDKL